jgi:hypothetical protein
VHLRIPKGEILLSLLFAALGILWIAGGVGMPFWEGFAPSSGFLPLVYGGLLVVLSLAALGTQFAGGEEAGEHVEPLKKPLLILAALTAGVTGITVAGFAASMLLLLLFLFVVVERLPIVRSAIVSAATVALLVLIFHTWLGIPLPLGPMGF